MSEFGEPWKNFYGDISTSESKLVIEQFPYKDCSAYDDEKYADRIVACVNFCRNLPTEWLQKHVASSDQSSFGKFSADDRIFVKENGE